ncbi:MaoC/PaaZ C-terminal domain-containing protein [Rhodococcus jostii]|uniref:MaoC/PaaZ C-terminal domain-containing protein n=1 Tax=Rhodococcus jostii TaxID=132919 RepID=UPI00059FA753|nr:MaoC/PaaZ C-terminal domain-containing protein [Rhodococcus jostii]
MLSPSELVGLSLGTRVVTYDETDAILYALAVGAAAEDTDYTYERGLRVLPTFALPLGLWTADAASAAGAFVPAEALHGAQYLSLRSPLPAAGQLSISGSIAAVWDTGRSALIDVLAECEEFSAIYSIILPGKGGFGGERKPRRTPVVAETDMDVTTEFDTNPSQAALYRLTGDRHAIHIDPVAARAAGFDRPILHGLCTLGVAAREVASASDRRPDELRELSARFVSPVKPGDRLATTCRTSAADAGSVAKFVVSVVERNVLADCFATFVR